LANDYPSVGLIRFKYLIESRIKILEPESHFLGKKGP
jgi:hypothetical protein